MAEFDLRNGNGAGNNGVKPVQNTTKETIDVTAGKVQRRGNYVTPEQARTIRAENASSNNAPQHDPTFDTPPTFKTNSSADSTIQSLQDDPTVDSYPGRTPVKSGSPKNVTPTIHSVKTDKPDVPDPTPLKIVDNYAAKVNSENLTPFDIHSLPKKKQEMGTAESEDLENLNEAVEREMKSISDRIDALTQKQYEEFMDAREEGRQVARPVTDEELAAEEEARINGTSEEEDTESETPQTKHFVIDDGEEETSEVKVDNSSKELALEQVGLNAISYVDNHVTSKDYFTRVMHARSYMDKHHVYSEIWAMVMYNHENESAVHPFLVAKKNGITCIVECNIESIKGVHTLDPNDTIEGIYNHFLHSGFLYEYIDYLAKTVILKLPTDMPTAENALKLANEKLGADKMSDKPIVEAEITEEPKKDELDEAINQEEAKDLYGSEPNDSSEVIEVVPADADEDTSTTATAEKHYTISEIDDGTTYETPEFHDVSIPVESVEENPIGQDEEDEDSSIVIKKEYEGGEAYQQASSDDLAKDLESELNVDVADNSANEEAMLNELRSAVKQNIPSIKNKINLRNFKISDTPISAAKVSAFSIADVNQADWVLPNAERVVTVRGLSGPELFSMNPQNSNKSRINTFRQIYGIIYKHIVSKKPKSFDEWLKITRFSDIDHLYAALHRATFSGSNFVHYECPECNHVFIKDYDFEEMVQYRDDKAKEKIHRILNSADTSIPSYDVKLSQISDDYVIGLKDPSIWNMVMETAALSEDFLSKYEDLMDTMSFIDSIYLIDRTTNELKPVSFDYDKDQPAKSTARKIIILSDIIKTLSSDNYFDLRNQIAQLFASSNDMTYKIPAAVCPKCGHKFEEEPTEGMRMLFTRHQLGALAVI